MLQVLNGLSSAYELKKLGTFSWSSLGTGTAMEGLTPGFVSNPSH
jgi:hypothetical protein